MTTTFEQYAAMNATQRSKINKNNLLSLLDAQIGQPTMVPEETLRNIIKDTIERSIEEKIPEDLGDIISKMKEDYDERIEKLENENKTLKKAVLEQQKFLEGAQRENTKNNVFITGVPEMIKEKLPIRKKLFVTYSSSSMKELQMKNTI